MSEAITRYKVRDLVIDDNFSTINSNATISEATQKMKENKVPDLVILDNDTQKVLGVLTDFDIVQQIVAEGKNPNEQSVQNVMKKIDPVPLNMPVEIAFVKMRDLKVDVVPVVRKGKLIGVCTIHDCWSYIPPEGATKLGLIPVQNPDSAKFWLASVSSLLAFFLGIIFPLAGIFGFYSAESSQLTSLLRLSTIRGDLLTFYLFDVHGTQVSINYSDLIERGGVAWVFLLIFGFAVLISGIIGLFSIFYASYSRLKGFHVGKFHQQMSPLLTVIFLIMEWVLLAVVLANNTPEISFTVDTTGLICSIAAILLILIAILRDKIFTQETGEIQYGRR